MVKCIVFLVKCIVFPSKIVFFYFYCSIDFNDNIWKRKAIEILEENGAKNIYATSNEVIENENSFYDEIKTERDLDERRTNPHA